MTILTHDEGAKRFMVLGTFWIQRLRKVGPGSILAILTIAAAVLRIFDLSTRSIWLDEATTAERVTLPLAPPLKAGATDDTMTVYYVVLHCWTAVAGTSEFMLRLPSALFAIATVPILYALGAELFNWRVGLVAALLLTVNATCIEYAQNARTYSMLMILVALSSFFLVRGIKRDHIDTNWIGYIVSGISGIYAHIFGIFTLPAQWFSLFLFQPDKKSPPN